MAVVPSRGDAACTPGDDCALDLGSSNAYVTFGAAAGLGVAEFTLETWFKRVGAGSTASTGTGGVTAVPLVTKGRGEADGSNQDMNYFLGIRGSDGVLVADFEEGAAGTTPGLNHPVIGVTSVPADGMWHHAAATYDGATWRLYLDGSLEAQVVVGQPPRSDSIQHAGLSTAMNSSGTPSGFFAGVLDEVRIWGFARTQAEIQATMFSEISSAAGLVARWGLNEGTGIAVNDSAGTPQNGTITGSGWSWVASTVFSAPDLPTLNQPGDGAVGVSTSPTLDVAVSDPDGDALTVTFHGRAAIDTPDFTIVALPDTQYYSCGSPCGSNPAIFQSQTQWIVDNKDTRNIVYVAQEGDCVEHGNLGNGSPDVEIEWKNADAAFDLIENPITTQLADGIPYGIAVGNHDQTPVGSPTPESTTTLYNQYFGASRFSGRGYYGGHYGSNNDNHYSLFSASGMDFIVIYFEYDTSANPAVLAWADSLLQTYSDRRAIIVSHWIINTGNPGSFGAQGQAIYDALKDNANLFLMLSGHVPGEGRRSDTFGGNTVTSLLSDYQNRSNGGNGWLRILTFSPANDLVFVETYSPWLDQFETDDSSQFVVPYAMGVPFDEIATLMNVPSGTDASTTWSGLQPGTTYEWYVEVSDGDTTVTGPVWTFTTSECGNGAVENSEGCDDGGGSSGDGCSSACQVETCFTCSGQPSLCVPANGAPCDDGLFCNGSDTCSGTACSVHSGSPCSGPDGDANCAESCDEASDACTAADPNGVPCDNGMFCDGTDSCTAGSCSSHAGNPCVGGTECADACNETADHCFDPAGTDCSGDGNVCTDDQCNGSGVCVHPNNVALCDDGLFCNGTDTCMAGSCSSHAGDPCSGGGECAQTCDETADHCFDPTGSACSDDGNACTDDQCNGAGACLHLNGDGPCDDGLACTVDDTCVDGGCVGGLPDECDDEDPCTQDACDDVQGCINAEEPAEICYIAARGQLVLRNGENDDADQLRWKWKRGEAADQSAFGDPQTTTSFTLCVYDSVAGIPALATALDVGAGGAWQDKGAKGWLYVDKSGLLDGVQQIKLKPGAAGKSAVQLKARGQNLPTPSPLESSFFAQDPRVTVQLFTSEGACWSSMFEANRLNTPKGFKAKQP